MTRRRAPAIRAAAWLVLGFGTLEAQSPSRLEPGDRVRVRSLSRSGSFDRGVKGTVERVVGDTVVIILPDGAGPQVQVHSRDHRFRLFRSRGHRSSAVRGAAIGAFLGAAAGAIVGLGLADPCPPPVQADDLGCIEGGSEALTGAIIGLGGGTAFGIVVGTLIPHEVWSPVAGFPSVGSMPLPPSRRVRFGASVAF